jgi:hypothetical protein
MFSTIEHHKVILNKFIEIKNDTSIPLKEKGTAFSSNRNIKEVIESIKNDIEDALKLIKVNEEFEKMLIGIKNFEKNPYDVIVFLSSINEHTFNYFNDEKDIEILKIILKIKERLNASQGLKEKDFYHSMKFSTLSFFPFNKEHNYGFSSQADFIHFFNILLDFLNIDFFICEIRDLNKQIQQKDLFFDNPLMEKVTPKNKKKHPIYDNPKFLKFFRELLQLSLKKSQYKKKR